MGKSQIQQLIDYIKVLTEKAEDARLDPSLFTGEERLLAEQVYALGTAIQETQKIAKDLADGAIDEEYAVSKNRLAAPLKSIQSNLRHLAWVAACVSRGNYKQKVRNMGRLTDAFNQMVHQLEEHRTEMEKQASIDYLTGLGNRYSYNKTVQALWKEKASFSIAYIDLDGLKNCNDQYGHAEGDGYIISVCDLLKSIKQEGESIFRIGGDEFIFLSKTENETTLKRRLEAARESYQKQWTYLQDCKRDFSCGCVLIDPTGKKSQSELFSIADQRMYNEKTIHYLQKNGYGSKVQVSHMTLSLNKTGLDDRMFEIFSSTEQNRYLYICNMETNVSRWSLQAVRDFNLPGEYMYDAKSIWLEHIHPEDRKIYLNDLDYVFSGRKRYHDVEYRARTKDGNYVICSCRGAILKGTDGHPDLFAGTMTSHGIVDNIDPVTNLYNVYEFLKQIERMRNERSAGNFLVLGINQFSRINAMYGYVIGNQILLEIAKRIEDMIRGKGQVFRLDGAKFAIILHNTSEQHIEAIYRKMTEIVRNQIYIGEFHVIPELSGAYMRLACVNVEAQTIFAELLHALSASKKERLGKLIKYDNNQDEKLKNEMELIDFLRKEIQNDCHGFYLVYQPQVDCNEKMIGVEALLRWENEAYGVVAPSVYIPILERDSCFYELGLWIIQRAMRETKKYLTRYPDFKVSINISYRQIEHFGFREDVMRLLRTEQFPAQNIIMELTEHCQSINPQMLEQDIRYFKGQGIQIAADDFGTGYSSFSLMRQLSFDYVKIDHSFIFHILEETRDQIMVESIIRCAKKLGIQVCIEGIEQKEIFDFVKQYGAECYQGYFFSKPMPLDQLGV